MQLHSLQRGFKSIHLDLESTPLIICLSRGICICRPIRKEWCRASSNRFRAASTSSTIVPYSAPICQRHGRASWWETDLTLHRDLPAAAVFSLPALINFEWAYGQSVCAITYKSVLFSEERRLYVTAARCGRAQTCSAVGVFTDALLWCILWCSFAERALHTHRGSFAETDMALNYQEKQRLAHLLGS